MRTVVGRWVRGPVVFLLLAWIGASPWMEVRADALVLLHGYQSDARVWLDSGLSRGLERHGWRFGGEVFNTPKGPMLRGGTGGERVYYVVNIPNEAPMTYQEQSLEPLLDALVKRHAGERVTLVGHSQGGVVARLAMVRHPEWGIFALITIASPHLGTNRAKLALLVGSTPLSLMANLVGGGTLNRSRQLYSELAEERPGTLLYWLNHQPHPPAHYISLVRRDGWLPLSGDLVVPERSQALENVAALQGRARGLFTDSGHGLTAEDGKIIGELLDEISGANLPRL